MTTFLPSLTETNHVTNNAPISKLTRDVIRIKSNDAYRARLLINDDLERESWVSGYDGFKGCD